jgi:hypothetical protein
MSFRIRNLFAALIIAMILTACSNAADNSGRLIYVTSSKSDSLSGAAQSSQTSKSEQESSGASSGNKGSKGSSSESSSKTADKNKSSKASSKSSSKSSSDRDSSSSDGGKVTEPPTESDVIGIYNTAVQNNASLSGVQFDFINKNSSNNSEMSGDIKFNNDYQSPLFLSVFDHISSFYINMKTNSFDIFMTDSWMPTGIDFNPEDTVKYTMILDPQLSVETVKSFKIENSQGNRLLSFEVSPSGFAGYASLYTIFDSKAAAISTIQLAYTVTPGGYVTGSVQVFGMSDGSTLEMDKTYIGIGSDISIVMTKR